VEGQLHQLRARRAVLRTILRQHTTTEQVSLMHKLVSMSDDDRERLINQFWDFVTDGLDVHPSYVERLHRLQPNLPEEPTTEQLEAWIELADLVQDEDFRTSTREFYHRAFDGERGKVITTPEMVARVERRRQLFLEAQAAQRAGVPADSPQARDIAERMATDAAEFAAALTGEYDADKARRSLADFERNSEIGRKMAKSTGLKLVIRYHTLVATINGTPTPDPAKAAATTEWMAAALRRPSDFDR
jgi:hypothetical protein